MKQLTLNGKTLGVVDVPEDASQLQIIDSDYGKYLWFQLPVIRGKTSKPLPPGQWSILGRLNDITEEQAVSIFNEFLLALHKIFEQNGITGNPLVLLKNNDNEK